MVIDEFDSTVEAELKRTCPSILYKYRDWGNEYHQNILLQNQFWLAHPKELNDPYDIRIPLVFDVDEHNTDAFFEKLKIDLAAKTPLIGFKNPLFTRLCEEKLLEIKKNPNELFERVNQDIRNGSFYNCFGVFSLSKNPLNEIMWAHYGNSSKGICIGFDLIKLYRDLKLSFGGVDYGDKPLKYSYLNSGKEFMFQYVFYKGIKWAYEEEYRFITPEIESNNDRLVSFNKEAIAEVILGFDISEEHKSDIIKVLRNNYNSKVDLYQTIQSSNSYGYKKVKIQY